MTWHYQPLPGAAAALTAPPSLTSITVSPSTATVIAGDTQQLTATGHYSDGSTADLTATATWDSADSGIATVDSSGLVTGVAGGVASISATSGAIQGTADITIIELSSIAVTPATATLTLSGTQQFTATATYTDSSTADVTADCTWSSSDAGIATVDASGLVTGAGGGTTTITAELGAESNTASVTVVATVSGTTLDAMDGSLAYKTVATIEGIDTILTDAPSAAVLAAYADTAWDSTTYTNVTVLSTLFTELHNEQTADPWDSFTRGGTAILRVAPDADDAFGILVARRAHGAETSLQATVDRDDTAISVASNSAFDASPAEAHIGSECIRYSGFSSTTMTASQRGMYSPFKTGTGDNNFANHHRVGLDSTQVSMNPVVSQEPRTWIGRRVAIRWHKWDGVSLNSRDDAQLVFAGRIASIAEDPNTFCVVIEVKNILDELADTTILRDQFVAQIPDGITTDGGTVSFVERIRVNSSTLTTNTANMLTISAGRYVGDELCGLLSDYLGGELAASRISGTYSWTFAESGPQGPRTKVHWHNSTASVTIEWAITMPKEIALFLGLRDRNPQDVGSSITFGASSPATSSTIATPGDVEPYRCMAFHFGGREGLSMQCPVENPVGIWVNQTEFLPTAVKAIQDGIDADLSLSWGLALIDGKTTVFCTFDNSDPTAPMFGNVYVAPLPQATDAVLETTIIGRKVTDAGGPVTISQVLSLEGTRANIIKQLFYSTGTAGYNHADYDTLGYGLGVGIPGELLGTAFEQSVDNLPGAQDSIQLVIPAGTKLSDLLGSDLLIMRAFPVWKNGGIRFHRWQTPISALAIATLNESNKGEPAGNVVNHRSASLEDSTFQRPIVKILYNRDYSFSRDETYQNSITLEDQTAVDDMGGDAKTVTIKMRNVYAQSTQAGAALESLLPGYLASMPMFTRAARKITRSIDQTLWERLAPGDIVDVEDSFARDPLTGLRNGPTRPATAVRVMYDPGGLSPSDGKGSVTVRDMVGEVDLMFLDIHRGGVYGPAALVDASANSGGFDAGYNDGAPSIRCVSHQFSESSETSDALRFKTGDVVRIIERDPANPGDPVMWTRTLTGATATDLTFDDALGSFGGEPAWDNGLTYLVTYADYPDVTVTQQDYAYEADATDELISDMEVADHYAITHDATDAWTPNTTTAATFLPDIAFGDGKTHDAGYDAELVNLANATIDHKTARNNPLMFTQYDIGNLDAGVTPNYGVAYVGPMFFGTEQLSNDVWRYLMLAPWFKLNNGGGATTGYVRVTVSRTPPVPLPGDSGLAGSTYDFYSFAQPYTQLTWGTTSTTWGVGSEQTVALNFKAPGTGLLWIMIETWNADCRGLAKVVEGARNYNA